MKYRIKTYHGDNVIVSSKTDLFNLFDTYSSYKPNYYSTIPEIKKYFVNSFMLSINEGNFFLKEEKLHYKYENLYHIYNGTHRRTYLNGLFILFDSYGNKVDLDAITDEYNQSRGFYDYAKQRKSNQYSDRSTAKWRKKNCWGDKSPIHNSFGKEYRDSFYAKEENVKIRQKRLSQIKFFHAFDYDYVEFRHTEKSWKSKKNRKQWQ